MRLDDLAVQLAIRDLMIQQRKDHYRSEFDQGGMIRAERMPLGDAAKV